MQPAPPLLETALALHRAGRLSEAEPLYRQLLTGNPRDATVLTNLGATLCGLNRFAEAEACLRQSLALGNASAPTYFHLAHACQSLDRLPEAAGYFCDAVRQQSDFLPGWCGLGAVQQQQGQLSEALASFEQALRLNPHETMARMRVASIYRRQGQDDLAIACYQDVIRQFEMTAAATNVPRGAGDDHANALFHLGDFALMQGDYAGAENFYRRTLHLAPGHAAAHLGLGMVLLAQGDWLAAWPHYEYHVECLSRSPVEKASARWDGTPLAERTLLVHAAQRGFGDVFQFIRYLPLIRRQSGRVLVEVPKPLIPLLEQSGFGDLIPSGSPLPRFDVQTWLVSLPALFQTTLDTIPCGVPYLTADPARVERWRKSLAELQGFRIGINWQGSKGYGLDRDRSFPLALLAPLAHVPGVTLISLQHGDGSEQLEALTQAANGFEVHRLQGLDAQGGAFMDTAAVMKNIDLVITCDSAVGHLAGAMGVPVWLALSAAPDWRWVRKRLDTPWYPETRLFRQRQTGDWSDVFARMVAELPSVAERKRKS